METRIDYDRIIRNEHDAYLTWFASDLIPKDEKFIKVAIHHIGIKGNVTFRVWVGGMIGFLVRPTRIEIEGSEDNPNIAPITLARGLVIARELQRRVSAFTEYNDQYWEVVFADERAKGHIR